jgi:MFS superfamily sulfate permease-like transporter
LIIAKQIPHALGLDYSEPGSLFEFLNLDHRPQSLPSHINAGPLLICMLSLAVMLIWEKPFIKKRVKFIPGALVAVIFSVIVNMIFKLGLNDFIIKDSFLVQVKSASSISEFFGFFTLPDFSGFSNSTVIITGIMIAIIASLETLLCIEAVDNLDPEKNVTNANRELLAQGLGNSVAGLIGGLPVTSVIVRSSANLYSGAKSKVSTIFHGFLLLSSIILIPNLLNLIPLASLAAILLITGYKLCNPVIFIRMFKKGKYQLVPFMTTVLTILALDLFVVYPPFKGEGLLIGVFFGLVSAMISILLGNFKNSYRFEEEKHHTGDKITIHLSEEVSFLNKASLRNTFNNLPQNSTVIIDASATKYIDFDVLELIKEFRDIRAPYKSIICKTINFKDSYKMNHTNFVGSSH